MAEASLRNVSFTQSDAAQIPRANRLMPPLAVTSCVFFPIPSQYCDLCLSWFSPAEFWLSKNLAGELFIGRPRACRFGARALL